MSLSDSISRTLSCPGYLFLGKAEMLLNHADGQARVDLRNRLFGRPCPLCSNPAGAAVETDVNGAET